MKKHPIAVIAGLYLLLIALVAAIPVSSHAAVAGSPHDFSTGGTSGFQSTSEDEVCIFCHTPHSAALPDRLGNEVPLWNRSLNEAGVFTMYTSPSLDGDVTYSLNKPTGYSLLCLSCHDGVTTINSVLNTGPNGPIIMPEPDAIGDIVYAPNSGPNIGSDLSNDHPVSFEYTDALVLLDTASRGGVAGLYAPGSVTWPGNPAGALKLFYNRLECPTCHDPHDDGSLTGQEPFLRMSNAGSQMCTTCHIK